MLFSDWQATTHALQPMQALMSIDHAPGVALVLVLGEHREAGTRLLASLAQRVRVLRELGERQRPHDVPLLRLLARLVVDRPVVLRARDHRAVSPVFATSRPAEDHGASLVRSAYAEKPVPVPTCPARVRP